MSSVATGPNVADPHIASIPRYIAFQASYNVSLVDIRIGFRFWDPLRAWWRSKVTSELEKTCLRPPPRANPQGLVRFPYCSPRVKAARIQKLRAVVTGPNVSGPHIASIPRYIASIPLYPSGSRAWGR